jgi:hypothetical protein
MSKRYPKLKVFFSAWTYLWREPDKAEDNGGDHAEVPADAKEVTA